MPAACEGADLCGELAGAQDTEFARTYGGDPPSRLLGGTQNLALLADLSPLADGHVLLLPRTHHLSFVSVAREHPDELAQVLDGLVLEYGRVWGSHLTVLEHGSAPDMVGTPCIHHAHWHLLPIPADEVDRIFVRDGLEHREVDGVAGLAQGPTGEPYFLRYAPDAGFRLYGVGRRVKRQYLRAVAGEILGLPDPEWDWTVVQRKDSLRRTVSAGPRLEATR
jgi:diadenosine tetraphosphate (Ap4A) HIT family hydrolase